MDKNEFNKFSIEEKVNYLNEEIKKGNTVSSIRKNLNIGEKVLQKEIKKGGYKYDNKTKHYIKITTSTTNSTTTSTTLPATNSATNSTTTDISLFNKEDSKYIVENIGLLKEIIENYKISKSVGDFSKSIVVNLTSDKHLNPRPHSLRINEFVWEDWVKFCEDNRYYSKQDLISMALREYIERHSE